MSAVRIIAFIAPSLKHTSCQILWAFQLCGSNTVIVKHNTAHSDHHRHISPRLPLEPAPGPPQLCASACPAAVHKRARCIQLCKNTFLIALPWENQTLQLIYSYPPISLWPGEENRGEGRTEKLLFFPFFFFERLPLKINGPLIRWKKNSGIGIISQMETGRAKP